MEIIGIYLIDCHVFVIWNEDLIFICSLCVCLMEIYELVLMLMCLVINVMSVFFCVLIC